MKLKLKTNIECTHTHTRHAISEKCYLRNLHFTKYIGEYLKDQIKTEMGV